MLFLITCRTGTPVKKCGYMHIGKNFLLLVITRIIALSVTIKRLKVLTSSMHLVQAIEALKFSKFKEMKLNLNVSDASEPFQLALSRNCTSEATSKVLEQHERLKEVGYLVTSTANFYVVASASSEHSVSLCLTRCMCAFYNRYSLPCAHILAARHFAQQDLFDKACILDRWCKDHFLSDTCMASSATPVVTSSIQLPPSVKLDTAQEKYSNTYKTLCEMPKTVADVLANCGEKELMENSASCKAFFRNLTTFPSNQITVSLQGTPAPLPQMTATSSCRHANSTKLVPLVKARTGRPKKAKAVKRKFLSSQKNIVGLAMVTAEMLNVCKCYFLSDADLNALVEGTSI
ncbi:uncharacterized protein LOC125940988 [Dermacentor silvarum]|uniref:uncharacterized protein LOC125940988 n=1 Tax=Dermacentor silvarum TaxID=543639 RepID=UPI0021010B56|nr:uncharacterized protein LOC125940988 [Dermacentor silvarum]